MKRILIAIPTAKNVETETFKSIYNLIIPEGHKADFQYFYGYSIQQIRNLLVDYSVKNNYEYTFCVDSDISFDPDTLVKMLNHNVDMVSGVYRQRLPNNIVEIYDYQLKNMPIENVMSSNFHEIGACGFGCVLINNRIIKGMEYPHFVYMSALDHKDTFSEDIYFCKKAREKGYKIYVDSTIICGHIGSYNYSISDIYSFDSPELKRLKELRAMDLLPKQHYNFLEFLKKEKGFEPKVIYDIGACVLHWTDRAKKLWPNSYYIAFEAMKEVEPIYQKEGIGYCLGILSDQVKEVDFYENIEHPGGNSYYKENIELSPRAEELFPESSIKKINTITLDYALEYFNFPIPDLIKMDVQGAELDVLKGGAKTIKKCNNIILELQHVDYNSGAAKKDEVIDYMNSLGFKTDGMFCCSSLGVDGDYYFYR